MTALRRVIELLGFRNGLCSQFEIAAAELIASARGLRSDLETYKRAPDPFGALLSTMHNNREFKKFRDHEVRKSKKVR